MMLILVVAFLIGAAYLIFRLRKQQAQEISAIAQMSATDRDRQMAPFHVQRFTRAIEQCDKPERLPELQRNLRYWQAVQAAEQVRP